MDEEIVPDDEFEITSDEIVPDEEFAFDDSPVEVVDDSEFQIEATPPPITPKQRPKERNMLEKGWDFSKDFAQGVAEGVGTMIPFTPKQHAPAYQMGMTAAQFPAEVVRGGLGFIGGSALAGGNPLGGVAAVTADEATRIGYEEGFDTLGDAKNVAHLGVTAATSMIPVKGASKIASATTGIKNKAMQKAATVGGIGAMDALASGVQGGSEVLRTGGDILSPEGLANVALSSGLGLGASVAGNAVTMHQPTKNFVEDPAGMTSPTIEDTLKLTHSPESFTERRVRETGWKDFETDPVALDKIESELELEAIRDDVLNEPSRRVDEALSRVRNKDGNLVFKQEENVPFPRELPSGNELVTDGLEEHLAKFDKEQQLELNNKIREKGRDRLKSLKKLSEDVRKGKRFLESDFKNEINNLEPPKPSKRTYREDIERDINGLPIPDDRIIQEIYHNPEMTLDDIREVLPTVSRKKFERSRKASEDIKYEIGNLKKHFGDYYDDYKTADRPQSVGGELVKYERENPNFTRRIIVDEETPPVDPNSYYSDDDILDMMESDIIRQKGGDGSNGKRLETYKPYQEGTSDPDTTPEIGLSSQDREEVVNLSPTQADGGNTRFESAVGEPTPMDSDFDYVRSKADALTSKENNTGDLRDILVEHGDEVMQNLRDDKYVGSTNMNRMGVSDDVKKITAAVLDTNATPYERRTVESIFKEAADLNINETNYTKINPDKLSPPEALALRNFTAGKLQEFARTGNARDKDIAIDALLRSDKAASTAGQLLQSYNAVSRAWEAQLPNWQRATINLSKILKHDKSSKNLMSKFLDKVEKLGDERNNPLKLAEVMRQIRDTDAGAWGQILSYRFANMLSSPMTHVINMTSNLSNIVSEGMILNPISEKVGLGLGRANKKLGTGVQSGENAYALANSVASLNGLADAGQNALHVLTKGITKKDLDNLDITNTFVSVFGGADSKAVRSLGLPFTAVNRLLQAGDEFFKTISYNVAVNKLAYRRAMEEASESGLSGKALDDFLNKKITEYKETDVAIQKKAVDEAKRIVYQEDLPFENVFADTVFGDLVKTVFQTIVPFVRTPFNVIKQGLEYTPAGIAATGLKAYSAKNNRGHTADDVVKSALRTLIGTSAMAALYKYFEAGYITGAVPQGESETFYGQGKKPFSIKIGDRWIDYRNLGKLAIPLTMTASVFEHVKKAEKEGREITSGDMLFELALNSAQHIAETPILTGISSATDAIENPTMADKFIANIASQYVPYSASQRFANNQKITSEYVPDPDTISERIQAGTVLTDKLPRRRNTLGLEVRRGTNPQLKKFYEEVDRLNIRLPKPSNYVKVDGESEKLGKADIRNILAERDELGVAQEVLAFVNSQTYQNMSDEEKKWELERELKRVIPKSKKSNAMWDIRDRIGLQREQKQKQ